MARPRKEPEPGAEFVAAPSSETALAEALARDPRAFVAMGDDEERAEFEALHPVPVVGMVVHYVLPERSPRRGEIRPAMIVRVFQPDTEHETNPGMSNLRVILDGPNDTRENDWQGSVLFDGGDEPKPGTWHWPRP